MWKNGWVGVTRAEQVRTTISEPAADRAPDLVNRQFRVSGSNELFFADVTYVPMDTGVFACTAFVIDACAGTIVGCECSIDQQNNSRPGSPTPGLASYQSEFRPAACPHRCADLGRFAVRLGRLTSSVQYPLVEGAGDGPLRGRGRSGPVGRCCFGGDQSGNYR